MIDFLLIVVEAHHPNGVTEESEKSYAHDWNRWKTILKQLNYATMKEITTVHKFWKSVRISDNFLRLAVEVCNQVGVCNSFKNLLSILCSFWLICRNFTSQNP